MWPLSASHVKPCGAYTPHHISWQSVDGVRHHAASFYRIVGHAAHSPASHYTGIHSHDRSLPDAAYPWRAIASVGFEHVIGGQLIQTSRIVLLTLHPEWADHEIMTENFLISYRHRPYQYPPKAWSELCRGFAGGSQELGASRSISSSDSPVIPAIRSLEIPAAFIA